MDASPHHGRSNLLGSPVSDLAAWSGAFWNCSEWKKPGRSSRGCALCRAGSSGRPQHTTQRAPVCRFCCTRKSQAIGELGKGVILTLICHNASSKWQLKQHFSDRNKTSDILSP